jgi:hypothetical protein
MTEPVTTCWICGAPANSAEHKIKKADLVRNYGKGPYLGPSAPVHVQGEKVTFVQGPGSTTLKYRPSLCHECNTTGTQPYDRAYDHFISWVFKNERLVLHRRFINFRDVYGESFGDCQRNLFKYFVKSFGCQLRDSSLPVPVDLTDLLPKTNFLTALKITFAVNEDTLLFPRSIRNRFMGHNQPLPSVSEKDPTEVIGYIWLQHVSWVTACYWYAEIPNGDLGSSWIANSQHIYLGSFVSRLSKRQRAEMISKVRQGKFDRYSESA